jgi:hypothetical protein
MVCLSSGGGLNMGWVSEIRDAIKIVKEWKDSKTKEAKERLVDIAKL